MTSQEWQRWERYLRGQGVPEEEIAERLAAIEDLEDDEDCGGEDDWCALPDDEDMDDGEWAEWLVWAIAIAVGLFILFGT